MQQQSTNSIVTLIKDGAIASSITLAAIGAVSIIAPGFPKPALAATSGAVGVVVATGQQQQRFRQRLQQDLAQFQQDLQHWGKALPPKENGGFDGLDLASSPLFPGELEELNDYTDTESDAAPDARNRASKPYKPPSTLRHQDSQGAIAWLTQVGIGVESHYQPQAGLDEIFDRLSGFLGTHYGALGPLYRQIKRNVAGGNRFRFSLASSSQREISLSTQFCAMLNRASLLSFYRYSNADKLIQAALQNRADVIRLFQGEWFERYVANEVAQWLDSRSLRYECLINPKILYENGDRFELDLVFMVEDAPLWIECKTGKDSNAYLERYSNHRKQLNIPKGRSLLVILDIPTEQAQTLTTLWDITVTNQELLLACVKEAIQPSPAAADSASEPEPSVDLHQQIHALLKERRIPPVPEYRLQVIHELVKLVRDVSPPMTLRQVKESLYEEMADMLQISKTKLQGILQTVLRSGCLLDQNHQPISSFNSPIYALATAEPENLDTQCVHQYASVVLTVDPTFFHHPQQVQVFEQVVGAPAPDPATLEELSRRALNGSPIPEDISDDPNDDDASDDDR
ncbi:MAG: hypothetical protein VKK04_11085 [Synechococcales bacterium]|nr:hypothetical protein [Synechococcales bacterium]